MTEVSSEFVAATVSGDCEMCRYRGRPPQIHPRVACPSQQPPVVHSDWNSVGRFSAEHDYQHACHLGVVGLDAMPKVGQVLLLTDGDMVCFGRVVRIGEGDHSEWFYVDEASDLTHLEATHSGRSEPS